MRFFDFYLGKVPRLIEQEPSLVLAPDGRNLAALVNRLQADAPQTLERITEYLRVVQPNLVRIEAVRIDDFATIDFDLQVGPHVQRFPISVLSDGTLNALAVLVTVFLPAAGLKEPPVLVGIEEPEKALHPAVSTLLADAFLEASRSVQILVTSHSPDLLEHEDLGVGSLVAVEAKDGVSCLGRLDEFALSVLRDELTTPGELHRQNQLRPEAVLADR
jgi:predicted ATPase